MTIGFDIISDLNLNEGAVFDWEGKPTSLFCLVAGNISSNLKTTLKVLHHLSSQYQGVFFIDGTLEVNDPYERDELVDNIGKQCSKLRNVVYLHNNVVVVDGVAIVGINGWYKNYETHSSSDEMQLQTNFLDDLLYLQKTIERLQLHVDVRKIIVMSNCVPSNKLYFGEDVGVLSSITLDNVESSDTEHKISHWVYATHGKIVDTTINRINYVNNPKHDREPYHAKRIEVIL